jgi:hypothetical protein
MREQLLDGDVSPVRGAIGEEAGERILQPEFAIAVNCLLTDAKR